jgi:exodeoxyribonuclease III
VKIATFNINGIERRLPNLLAWLRAAAPDVACLQEIKCTNAAFPRAALEDAGYAAIWRGQGPHHGVAILARGAVPIETRRELPGDPTDREARYIEAAVNGVLVGCLYLPNGNPQPGPKFVYKLNWFGRLLAYAAELRGGGVPAVLAGDYNVVPTDADIYDMRSWKDNALVQPEPRALYAQLTGNGWTDALRALHRSAAMYTFWHYLRKRWERDAGMRLDHLLLSEALAPRLVDAGVDRNVRGEPNASDHAPAWITLSAGVGR